MKALIASAIFLLMLVSVEPAFSHSGGTDDSGCHAGSKPYHCHDEDDYFGCAIAGPEHPDGSILLNLLFIGLNVFPDERQNPSFPASRTIE